MYQPFPSEEDMDFILNLEVSFSSDCEETKSVMVEESVASKDPSLSRSMTKHLKKLHIHNVSRDPAVIKLPRIPKEDIRRKYPMMLLNTVNSMDISRLYQFLNTFTHPQTLLKRQIMSHHDPRLEAQSMSLYGSEEIFRFMYVLGLMGPDRIFTLDHCAILTKSTTYQTQIVLDVTINVSYLYGADATTASDFLQVFHAEQYAKMRSLLNDQQLKEMEVAFAQNFPVLTTPLPRSLKRKVILVINNVYDREELDAIYIQVPPTPPPPRSFPSTSSY